MTRHDPGVPWEDTAVAELESTPGGPRVRPAAGALADRALAHRGRAGDAGRGRAGARAARRTGWPRWPTGPARGCGRRTCRSTCADGAPAERRAHGGAGSAPGPAAGCPGGSRAQGGRRTSRPVRTAGLLAGELKDVNSSLRGLIGAGGARRRRAGRGLPRRGRAGARRGEPPERRSRGRRAPPPAARPQAARRGRGGRPPLPERRAGGGSRRRRLAAGHRGRLGRSARRSARPAPPPSPRW